MPHAVRVQPAPKPRPSPSPEAVPGDRRTKWVCVALLVVCVLAVFGRIVGQQFTWWDDYLTIHQNPLFRGGHVGALHRPGVDSIVYFWTHPAEEMYVPVTYSLWGVAAMTGWNATNVAPEINLYAAPFHVESLLVHLVSTLLVFGILRRLVRAEWPAALGALLFALHPLQVESVAWATGLKESLCGMFSFGALLQYVRIAQQPHGGIDAERVERSGQIDARLVLMLAFEALAMLSNPLAIVTPLVAFVIDGLILRRGIRQAVRLSGCLLLAALPFAVVASMVQPATGVHNVDLAHRPFIAGDALAFYLGKLVWPLNVAADYARRPLLVLARGRLYWTTMAAVGVLAIGWLARWRAPWLLGALVIFAVGLAPVLGFKTFEYQKFSTVADRYVYISMLGPALALAFWLRGRPTNRARVGITAFVLLVLGVLSFIQCGYWRDDVALWTHTLALTPNSAVGHLNLAGDYTRLNRRDLTFEQYQAAVDADPTLFNAQDGIATALIRKGQIDEAIPHMWKSLQIAETLPPERRAHVEEGALFLGQQLIQRGRTPEAVAMLAELCADEPGNQVLKAALAQARMIERRQSSTSAPATSQAVR